MLFEITHLSETSRTTWVEEKLFQSTSEAELFCKQHSNRIEFLRVTKVIREVPKVA